MELSPLKLKHSVQPKLFRSKRNNVENHLFTMEVLVAVDKTMSEFHKEDLKSYILTLISIVRIKNPIGK